MKRAVTNLELAYREMLRYSDVPKAVTSRTNLSKSQLLIFFCASLSQSQPDRSAAGRIVWEYISGAGGFGDGRR
ncbi:hypothetical protein Tco_0594114 [Tanacetum coccineum]